MLAIPGDSACLVTTVPAAISNSANLGVPLPQSIHSACFRPTTSGFIIITDTNGETHHSRWLWRDQINTRWQFRVPTPPYPGFASPIGLPQPNQFPVDSPKSPSILKRTASWTNTRSFVAFVTFIITVGLCMSTMPVTYCNYQREEEERQKLHMFWGHVEAHTCTTYATREYTAQLMNLPTSWRHRLDACKATPLEVHGISYLPKACEDKGPGVVIGRWEINQLEPDCTTFWAEYNDKGCTSPGSGKKHITHHLMNVPEKSDWREFCATTPAHFNHMQFPGAQECFESVWGVYGQWEIDHETC